MQRNIAAGEMVAPREEDDLGFDPVLRESAIRPLFESMASDETRFFTIGFWVLPMYEAEEDGSVEEEIKTTTFLGPARHMISIIVGWMAAGAILAYVEQEPVAIARNRVVPIYKGEIVEGKEGFGKSPAPDPQRRYKKKTDGRDRKPYLKARRAEYRRQTKENRAILKARGFDVPKVNKGNKAAQRKRAKERAKAKKGKPE